MKQEVYRYYSTQRPVDIGTYPKEPDNPMVGFLNYDERTSVEHGAYRAWGELFYRAPLTADQMYEYELRPSRDNPDVKPFDRRLTQCTGIGAFTYGPRVTPEQLAERYRLAQDLPLVPRCRPRPKKQQSITER